MFVELLQAGVRTLYRALGGREVESRAGDAVVRGFRFDPREGEPERTVVLVHGLGDASTTWHRLVPSLREQARVLAVDLPPFGVSELADGHARAPDEHARLVAPLVREHALGPVTVVGQSLGGWVTQWLLLDHPDLAERAVLVAPAGAPLEGSYDAVQLLTPHSLDEALTYLDALWYERPLGIQAAVRPILERLHGPEIRGFLAITDRSHALTEDELAGIGTPVHVVWGADDGLLDGETPAFLAEGWGAPVQRSYLARAGHMVHLERPDALEAIVRDASGLPPAP